MTRVNGWHNAATWNVSLWLSNDEIMYRMLRGFMPDYKGKDPYIDFIRHAGLQDKKTGDAVSWLDKEIDYKRMNQLMKELCE